MKAVTLILVLSTWAIIQVHGKIFMSCELAKELSANNIKRHLIPHFICLAQAESHMNTSKITDMPNKSANYGIFQINSSKNYCNKDMEGGWCGIKCSDLLNDNIKDDIKCAKDIFERDGFKAWKGWVNSCKSTSTTEKNNALPNLINCQYK